MRTKILLCLFLGLFGLSSQAISQIVPAFEIGKGPKGNPTSADCNISGSSVFAGEDMISNFSLFSVSRTYNGPGADSDCDNQTWKWTVTGTGIMIVGADNQASVDVVITNPSADGAKVKLKHCCGGTDDCAECEITIRVEAPQVTSVNGPSEVDCNTSQTYTSSLLGDLNFTTVTWTVDNSNATLTPTGTDVMVAFAQGNYTVNLCATACYGSNCQTFPVCRTIQVGRKPIEWTTFDDYLCVGTSGTYGVAGAVGNYVWRFNGSVLSGVTGSSHTFDPGASGDLSVTGTNSCGFSSTITQAITYVTDPPADPGLILNMTEGESGYPGPLTNIQTCSNATILLKVLDIDGPNDFAEWSYHNVSNLPGPPATFNTTTSNDMVLQFKYASSYDPNLTGVCSVEVKVNNNCFDSRYNSWRTIQISPTGGSGIGGCGGGFKHGGVAGEEGELQEYFQIGPNPAANQVNVHYQVMEEMTLSMSLMDIYGKEVDRIFTEVRHTPTPYVTNFGVSNYANGVYFCVLKDEEGNVLKSEKLIIKKD